MPLSEKPKILLLGNIDHAQKEWEALSGIAVLVKSCATNRKDFIKECRDGKLDGVVAAYSTLASRGTVGIFDRELVDVLPKSWTFLCHCAAGYDQIDVEACSAREPKLHVSNVPNITDDATSDTAIFLMIGTLRNLNVSMNSLRQGEWRGSPLPALGHDLRGKVLGILGMGSIGLNITKKARAWDMATIYHNRRKLHEDQAGGAEYVSLKELLERSDILSLNLPLTPGTFHFISTKEFNLMKPSAVIVNTARGAIIDEAALVDALDRHVISGAGLDVYEDEPKIHDGLIRNQKVMLLPHMGTWTTETQYQMELCVISNIREAIEKGKLLSPIQEQTNL